MKFLFKLTNGLFDCPDLMGYLMYRVPSGRTTQNDCFVNGNSSLLCMENCPTTRMCKLANDRSIDVFEVVLLDIKDILLEFELETIFR